MVTAWMSNVSGLKSAEKQACIWAQAMAASADLVMLAESHLAPLHGFDKAARAAGFPVCLSSSLGTTRCGVVICGPSHLRADPWVWPDKWRGRVVSGVLHGRARQTLVIHAYFDVDSELERADLAAGIAERIAVASLPTIFGADFNAQPHELALDSLEVLCDYAHELVDVEYLSTATKCIDFFLTSQLTVVDVSAEQAVTEPHRSVRCRVELPSPGTFPTVVKAKAIVVPDDWEDRWLAERTPERKQSYDRMLGDGDVVGAWNCWCSSLESAAGVAEPTRHLGTRLVRKEMVHRGPDGQRQPVVERRLHRILRRLRQREETGPARGVDRAIRRSLHALVQEQVVVDTDPDDWGAMRNAIYDKLGSLAVEVVKQRVASWREGVAGGNLRSIHRSLAREKACVARAFGAPDGSVTSDPDAVMAAALEQWRRKQVGPLDTALAAEYRKRIAAHITPERLDPRISAPLTEKELLAAIRACGGTSTGPTQWRAEDLAKMPPDALREFTRLANVIRELGLWPEVLATQEICMIPKADESSTDLRPIGVTAVLARAIGRAVVRRYRDWARLVQPTDTYQSLIEVDGFISEAMLESRGFVLRLSDLSNCFSRIDPTLFRDAATALGMLAKDAALLCNVNVSRPTTVRLGNLASDWQAVLRGMCQGDPASPLAAAVLAGTHRRLLAVEVPHPAVKLGTYVDDRQLLAPDRIIMRTAVVALQELDRISGQMEDPKKEEGLSFGQTQELAPGDAAEKDHVDLLGVRFYLDEQGRVGLDAPRVMKRFDKLVTRLERLRSLARAAALSPKQIVAVISAQAGIARWDAGWLLWTDAMRKKVRGLIEGIMTNRGRFLGWRHRGAFWLSVQSGWSLDPLGIAVGSVINTIGKIMRSGAAALWCKVWNGVDAGMGAVSRGFHRHAREVLAEVGITAVFTLEPTPRAVLTLGTTSVSTAEPAPRMQHLAREAWRAHAVVTAATTRRKMPLHATSIDTEVWKRFSRGISKDQRVRAVRCWSAAEPCQARLKHLEPGMAARCWDCDDENPDTMHTMWLCPGSAACRLRHGLDLASVRAAAPPGADGTSFAQNGWLPAAHEAQSVPAAINMAVRILKFKMQVFHRQFVLLEACRRARWA